MRRLDNFRVLAVDRRRQSLPGLQRYAPGQMRWFGSGREALLALLMGHPFKRRTVLLPAMVPEGVYFPFQRQNWRIIYYDLDEYGNPDFEGVAERATAFAPDMAVIIHLFGIVRDTVRFKSLLPEDCCLVEDFAHSTFCDWLAGYQSPADLCLFSPPKLLGVTDGCLIIALRSDLVFFPPRPWSWLRSRHLFARLASLALGAASQYLGKWDSLDVLARSATWFYNLSYRLLMRYCIHPHTFSRVGRWLLSHTDHQRVAEQRMRQVELYHQLLQNPLLKPIHSVDLGCIPLIGFPVVTPHRRELAAYLQQWGIRGAAYTDRWWFLPDEQRENYPHAWYLLQTHYVLPVNQKLSLSDIQLVIKRVNEFVV